MGKGSATAISNIRRHLTDFSFCTGYLALGFSLISPSHFLHVLLRIVAYVMSDQIPESWISVCNVSVVVLVTDQVI